MSWNMIGTQPPPWFRAFSTCACRSATDVSTSTGLKVRTAQRLRGGMVSAHVCVCAQLPPMFSSQPARPLVKPQAATACCAVPA